VTTQSVDPARAAEPAVDLTELFHDDHLPVVRQLGERPRGVAEPIDERDADTSAAVWQGLAGAGALELGLPDVTGTMPRLRPVAPVAEVIGRALYQSPYFDTLTAMDLLAVSAAADGHGLLDPIAAGEVTIAVAVQDDREDLCLPGRIEADPRTGRLSGVRRFVAFAPDVDYLLVVGRPSDDAAPIAALVSPGRPGVVARRHDDIGRGDLYAVMFDSVPVELDVGLPGGWHGVLARARLRHACYLVGLCLGALELSVGYARRRQVFGQALGKFQGPAFRLAELAARTEAVRTLAHQACADADAGAAVELAACHAVLLAGELATDVGAEAIQLHGSYGMTMACDAQRFYRRAVVDGIRFGTGRQLRREAMTLISGTTGEGVRA
jgi:alkylation response protein AidB-like acyl-CoA dehydrogenase